MADSFTYNTVSISNPLIDTLSAEAIYDDAGASVIYTKIVYRVSGTIQGSSNADFAAQLATARKSLMVPRATLNIVMGGQTLFNAAFDYKTGPTPRNVKFNEIVGALFCIVVFEIEVNMQEKCASDAATWFIISHVYSVTHSIDEACYTTRHLRGKFRVKPFALSNNPDILRSLITPSLPKDFRRESMDFVLSYDGLELEYAITDKELYRSPPASAIKASGKFSHQMDNFVWFNHISLEFSGNKYQRKIDMLRDIFLNVYSRISFSSGNELIRHAILEEELFDNTIRIQITSQISGDATTDDPDNDIPIFPRKTKIFTLLPNENHQVSNLGPYGSSLLASAKKVFHDPCTETVIRYAQRLGVNQIPSIDGAGSGNVTDSPPSGSFSTVLSSAQKEQPYIHWENYISYDQNNGCEVLPSTKAGTPGKVYQWHVPYQVVYQHGCAIRSNAPVVVPAPQSVSIDGNPMQGILRRKHVVPGAPQLQPDKKSYQFSASWEYEILVPMASSNLIASGKFSDANTGALPQPVNNASTFDPTTAATKLAKVSTPIVIA